MFVAVRVSSLSFWSQSSGSRSRSHGRSPRQIAEEAGLETASATTAAFAAAHDSHVGGIGARALLFDPHRLMAGLTTMHDPFPVDVLQMSLFAGADEADRRHVGFLAIVENKPTAPSSRVEILPAHETSTARLSCRQTCAVSTCSHRK